MEMFDIFDKSEEEGFMKTFEKSLIQDNIFLSKVDLFASKYERLDQMNSLLPFHLLERGFKDVPTYCF